MLFVLIPIVDPSFPEFPCGITATVINNKMTLNLCLPCLAHYGIPISFNKIRKF